MYLWQHVLNLRDLVVSGGGHVSAWPAAAQVILVVCREELGNAGIRLESAVLSVGFTCWRYGKNIISRFTIQSGFSAMLVLLYCKLSEQWSQTNFPILKTKPYKVTRYKIKKSGRYLGQRGEDKNLCHYFIFAIKK